MPSRRHVEGGDLSAIFVHAGAGYHSHQNEKVHLQAVSDAAKVGMAILKNGGTAVDAVEMAIRLLEDRDITNAGYGSNLTIEGVVECDATMVDHYGRSGAVGAVAQVKNPIAVARLVLEESCKQLSLQRVPPNLLVGIGATEFASENDIPVLPPDFLVSDPARERWKKWKQDLLNVQAREKRNSTKHSPGQLETRDLPSPAPAYNMPESPESQNGDHSTSSYFQTVMRSPESPMPELVAYNQNANGAATHVPTPPLPYPRYSHQKSPISQTNNDSIVDDRTAWAHVSSPVKRPRLDGDGSWEQASDDEDCLDPPTLDPIYRPSQPTANPHEDNITDTVGCIAIDCYGNIAAGSSSGGIGMKHKGRCGPAALVGIGTAVIPADPSDDSLVSVASVTSGTGEHMATTVAAATAADRIYASVKKVSGKLVPCSEDEAVHSFIKYDFMRHAGVQNSHCAGAIGVLTVKKSKDGIYFYFGHNTDSFAIASMHSEERQPVCVMSRSKGNGSIAQGGRRAKAKRAKE